MRILLHLAVMLSLLPVGAALAQVQPIPKGWQVERTVLLSLHGVRAPETPNDELDSRSATPWPTWSVQPGELTPRGAELMKLMGGFYRVLYGGRGLIQADDCPPAGSVSAWTDTDQRSRMTGSAMLSGMYPRCGRDMSLSHPPTAADPLFHPAPTARCPMDAASNRQAVLDRIGGDFSSVLREYASQLSLIQATLCPPSLVRPGSQCGLSTRASAVESAADGSVRLVGPVATAADAAEDFLMEDAEGLPPDQVAWGRLSGEGQLRDALKIRRLEIDLVAKTPSIARQRGSSLLAQIGATLKDGHDFPGQPKVAEPVRLAILVGQVTNVANVARLLNLHWQITGFQPNEIVPGGALAFELMRDVKTTRQYVRLAYFAQTMEQMRAVAHLDAPHPPGMVEVALPACQADLYEQACPLERFVEIVGQAVEPGCIAARP